MLTRPRYRHQLSGASQDVAIFRPLTSRLDAHTASQSRNLAGIDTWQLLAQGWSGALGEAPRVRDRAYLEGTYRGDRQLAI